MSPRVGAPLRTLITGRVTGRLAGPRFAGGGCPAV